MHRDLNLTKNPLKTDVAPRGLTERGKVLLRRRKTETKMASSLQFPRFFPLDFVYMQPVE